MNYKALVWNKNPPFDDQGGKIGLFAYDEVVACQ